MRISSPYLVKAAVTGVLGEYNHSVEFPPGKDFVILYGPNGVGKTKFLEIVHALSRLDGAALVDLPFSAARLVYSDGSSLSALNSSEIDLRRPDLASKMSSTSCNFVYRHPGRPKEEWRYTPGRVAEWLADNTTWRQVAPDLWEDRVDGEVCTITELRRRYPLEDEAGGRPPGVFREIGRQRSSFLIETQRLQSQKRQEPTGPPWRYQRTRDTPLSKIAQQSETMKTLISDAQTQHSRITQQLDRTFPNRVLGSKAERLENESNLRQRYNEQNVFRSQLGRLASVDLEDALSLPDRELSDWERQLLSLYLKDTEQKLRPFRALLGKVELLEQIVNSRLMRKHLQVTASEGLTVRHQKTNDAIQLDSLSSGEQHEIILMFDLLFNVPNGALVMIDEPEISLHVAWQLSFIPDVKRAADLSGFRFIVATHSPQIINNEWDSTVRLGPPEAAFA